MRRYVEWIIRHRLKVIIATLLVTVFMISQARYLKLAIDPNSMLPKTHPYVMTTKKVEDVFGSKYVIVIGVTPREGNAYQPKVLSKVQRITAALLESPGIVRENLLSLSARKAKNIEGNEDGLTVTPLMAKVPQGEEETLRLRKAVEENPAYINAIISKDGKTASIIAEFREGKGGFREMVEKVTPIVEREKGDGVEINVGGLPVYLANIERFSERMGYLLPIAILVVGLIHLEAFRTVQGLLLPLVTAIIAAIWGVGVMGFLGIPLDVLNVTTPILILAVAAGHAVQLLKRYYEEYDRIREDKMVEPKEANRRAVIESVSKVGIVMLTAGGVAAAGFFSLTVFEIASVRTFGLFTGLGILSALFLEMTFIPALRSVLPPPKEKSPDKKEGKRVWDRITESIAFLVTERRGWIAATIAVLVVISAVGITELKVDNSNKGLFSQDFDFQHDDRELNGKLGGTNTLYITVEGGAQDDIKDPQVLKNIESVQMLLEKEPNVGKTISIVDFIKKMNQAMHNGDKAYYSIPESQELVSQYLLLYSMSGEPGDFDTYVDYDYRTANVTAFLKTDSSAYVQELIGKVKAYTDEAFGDKVIVGFGGSVPQSAALNEVMVQGKLLNIAQIGAVVFVVATIVFRSVSAGIMVLIPLLMAVLANFGLMGLTGMKLNIPTSLSAAMAIGIGADYAIYLIFRLKEELQKGTDEKEAVKAAIRTAGKASLFVASAIAGGYGMLLFSFGFYIHMWLAILIGNAMLVSVLATLTIIPSIVLTHRPSFVYRRERRSFWPATATWAIAAFCLSLAAYPASAAELTAEEIMEKNFVASKVSDSVSDATFTLINKNGQERVRKTFGTTKLQPNGVDNMRMTRFLSPPDVKGTVSLLVEHSQKDDDIWIYLPALKKVRRLVSSNKKDSFVGTDFSYGDVIGQKVKEWKHRTIKEEKADGIDCYVIESTSASEEVKSTSGYSRRLGWIAKDSFVLVKSELWDESGMPLKTITMSDIRLVDREKMKYQPMTMEAKNLQTGHRTVIKLEGFTVNQGIKDEYFSTRYMERD